jgi:hypothetical protein
VPRRCDVNGTAASRRRSRCFFLRHRRSERENKGKIWTSMTAENRRNEEQSEAEAKESRESLVPLLKSAVAVKTERSTAFLPGKLGSSDHEPPYTVPYVRWCERTGADWLPPTRSLGVVLNNKSLLLQGRLNIFQVF